MKIGFDRIGSAFGSLKLSITLGGIVALTLGIVLNTVFLTGSAERDTLNAHRSRDTGESVRTAQMLGQRISDLKRGLEAFGEQLDGTTVADPAALARLLKSKRVLAGMFATLFITGPNGNMLVFSDDAGVHGAGFSIADRDYFQRTKAEDRPVVSGPIPGRLSGDQVIVFTQPLHRAGAFNGLLGGSVRLAAEGFIADLITATQDNDGTLSVVTDSAGRVLVHPGSQHMQSLSEEPRLAEAFTAWQRQAGPAPNGVSLPQRGQIVSAALAPGSDWIVWRACSEEDVLAPLRAVRRVAGYWATGLVAALSALLFSALYWLFRPLAMLEKRAQHLFDGDLEVHQGWPDARGEIGRLERVLRHVGAERAQLETFNAQVLRKLGSVMSAAPIGIAFTLNNRFELLSSEFCRLTGRGEHALMGQPMHLIFLSIDDHRALDEQAQQAFESGRSYVGEWQMLRADGSHFWARLRGGPVDANEIALGAIWTLNDISDQMAKRQELQWSATHDPLTGLANRKGFDQRAAAVFGALPNAVPAALVFIDLDHFKPINDTAGHAAGDAMLRAVAAAMSSRVRKTDLVVRLGGDEFALLLERCSHEVAMRVAEGVRCAICAIALPWEDRILQVGASLGIASLTTETLGVDAWLRAADAACYAAKGAGRGTVRVAPGPVLRLIGAAAPTEITADATAA